jgi:ribosomal protein L11 methyltransferase
VTSEERRDWLAEWKKGFKPFELAGGHWVVPSWCETPSEAKHAIRIDPGMAFGTGTHETTQLVAEALLDLKVAGGSVLDVGTGTGILAILAQQLGAKRVWATEIEADSRRVARENFNLNNCGDIIMNDRQVEDLNEKFTIVVANIIDGVLVRIQDALKARVKPGGWLVVSGIIGEREKDFVEGFQLPAGKQWAARKQKGDWILYAVEI